MITKAKLLQMLPPFRNELALVTYDQSTAEIIKEIISTHREFEPDYDCIGMCFEQGDIDTTCKYIFDFLKKSFPYTMESDNEQTVKSPAAILQPGAKIDCKHYSLFAGGVIDSISYLTGQDIPWCYRFAGYRSRDIEHVFVVVFPGTNDEIWIDPVMNIYNDHFEQVPKYFTDKKVPQTMTVGNLYKISGVNPSVTVDVDSDQAIESFLIMVNQNYFNLKSILKSSPDIVDTRVKGYFIKNGWDRQFLVLKNILNG